MRPSRVGFGLGEERPPRARRTAHPPARGVALELLRSHDFRNVWLTGTGVSVLRWLELLAISIYVLERTGSPFLVALMTFVRMAPMFLFGIPAGALADRYDRRQLLILGLAVLGLSSAGLGALAYSDRIELWHIGAGAFLSGAFWSAEFPVRRTMLGEIAGVTRLSQAMALESATSNATRMVGPALGGILIQMVGLYGVYVAGVILYAAGVLLILRVGYRSATGGGSGGTLLTMLLEGWRFTRSRRVIVGALAVTVIVNLWGFAYITMVPVIGERALGLTPVLIGVLMSTEGLGAVIGALLVARFERPSWHSRIYLGSSFVFLLGVLAFAQSPWFPLSLALILLCGIGIAGFSVMQSTIIFLASAPALRSRVMGVLTVSIGAGPIGMVHVGLLADGLGATTAVAIIALEGLIALALAARYWPELWRPLGLEQQSGTDQAG